MPGIQRSNDRGTREARPIAIEGAEPGDALEIEILEVLPADWGWTAVIPGFGLLADDFPAPHLRISRIDATHAEPIPGIRLRALQSRDIRAPNLSELIPPLQGANGSFLNEFTGNQTPQNIIGATGGNLGLKPEKAQTTELGIVWQPDYIPGFQMSVDWTLKVYNEKALGIIAEISDATAATA